MNKTWLSILGLAFAGGLGVAGWQLAKINKLLKKVGLSFDKLVDETEKEITDDVRQETIEAAIEQAVERKTEKALREAKSDALNQLKNDIRKQVGDAVRLEEKDIRERVSDEIADRVSKIDEEALKQKVTEKAEKEIMRRFDGSLNGVLSDFNRSLGNVAKIYENIAGTLSKDGGSSGREIKFTL